MIFHVKFKQNWKYFIFPDVTIENKNFAEEIKHFALESIPEKVLFIIHENYKC